MNVYDPRSMLVTGGAGFIGSHFIHHVLANFPNTNIINLDKLTYAGSLDYLKNLPHPERHHFIRGDIADSQLVNHILQHHHVDTIVHFAAESHVDRSITSPLAFVETNVLGTFVLLEAARHHWLDIDKMKPTQCRFHHVSTDEVYGSLMLGDLPFNEKTAYSPRSPYAASKAGSDHLVMAYHHTYGLPITLSHCSNNYGPHQNDEKFIPTIIRSSLKKVRIPIYGNGKNRRDWLYVKDHANAIMKIIRDGKVGEIYDIGGENEWENIALARYICELLDKMVPNGPSYTTLLDFVTDRPGHDFRYAINSAKIKKELQWEPKGAFESCMRETVQYYLDKIDHAY
jgi:dTDP-glucose 4,6-dehydratase